MADLGVIDKIVRDVCELEYDPYPDQPDNEIRCTIDELRVILTNRLQEAYPAINNS
jgi:hypothetical protein